MTRYLPSRNYLYLGLIATGLAILSGALAVRWAPAAVPAGLFLATAALNFYLSRRPVIELTSQTITIGDKEYLWSEIETIERTGWVSPLVVWIVFHDGTRTVLIYPGALQGSRRLSEELSRRLSRSREAARARAVVTASAGIGAMTKERVPLLTAEDEAEVERLFRRLKTVGHLESDER